MRSPEELARATPAEKLLWIAGVTGNSDPTEDIEEDWALDPWLYEVGEQCSDPCSEQGGGRFGMNCAIG